MECLGALVGAVAGGGLPHPPGKRLLGAPDDGEPRVAGARSLGCRGRVIGRGVIEHEHSEIVDAALTGQILDEGGQSPDLVAGRNADRDRFGDGAARHPQTWGAPQIDGGDGHTGHGQQRTSADQLHDRRGRHTVDESFRRPLPTAGSLLRASHAKAPTITATPSVTPAMIPAQPAKLRVLGSE